jgi:hypothetical protein
MSYGCRLVFKEEEASEVMMQSYKSKPQPKISADQEAALDKVRKALSDEIANGSYYNFATERRRILGEIQTHSTFGEDGVNIRYETFNSFPINWGNDEQILFLPRKIGDEKLRLVYACSLGVYVDILS